MNAEATEIKVERPSLVRKFASKYSIDPKVLLATLKATCFRQSDGDVSDEQMVALLVVADQYNLSPFTKEIYAFPDKNRGIVPVVSVDGWVRIINEHPDFNGYEVLLPDAQLAAIENERPAAWEWVTIKLHRKSVEFTPALTEYLDECYRAPIKKNGSNGPYTINGPWQSHPKRFLRHKALIQAARVVFGFSGIYDDDEAQRIIEAQRTMDVVATQTTRTASAKEALKKSLEQTKGNPATNLQNTQKLDPDGAIQRELIDQQRLAESRQHNVDVEKRAADVLNERPAFRFDVAAGLAHLRAAKTLAALKVAWREVEDDYEFSGRELPIDIEAIYRELKDAFDFKEAT